ncbi:hypothetical protein IWZ03DRAFT_430926 [Phyllosticta citriasiana]|uniref:Uncharacterized protein n=2 Tax=Phyllosticta citriasiana TaxID=595635 RepID=A0ABR1KFX5_9PEZI
MHPQKRPLTLLILLILLTTLALSPTTTTAHPLRHHSYRHGHVALHPAPHAYTHSHSYKSHEYHKEQHHAHDKSRSMHRRLAATQMEKALAERTRLHAPAVQLPRPHTRTRKILPSFRRVWKWGRGRVVSGISLKKSTTTAHKTAATVNKSGNGNGHGKRDLRET